MSRQKTPLDVLRERLGYRSAQASAMSTQKTPLGGHQISRKEAFKGLGDRKTWKRFSDTVYAEFRAKPKMEPAAGSLLSATAEKIKKVFGPTTGQKIEPVYAQYAKGRWVKKKSKARDKLERTFNRANLLREFKKARGNVARAAAGAGLHPKVFRAKWAKAGLPPFASKHAEQRSAKMRLRKANRRNKIKAGNVPSS